MPVNSIRDCVEKIIQHDKRLDKYVSTNQCDSSYQETKERPYDCLNRGRKSTFHIQHVAIISRSLNNLRLISSA